MIKKHLFIDSDEWRLLLDALDYYSKHLHRDSLVFDDEESDLLLSLSDDCDKLYLKIYDL